MVCKIGKESNFSSFKFLEYGKESEHLRHFDAADKAQVKNKAFELKKSGYSNVKIALELGVSEGAVRKWLKQAEIEE